MANLAAVIPSAKAPLEVRQVEKYTPGPHELLIKNEVIAFNPVEAKIAKLAMLPVSYPAIIGSSYGGVVESLGSDVTGFKVGDKVAVFPKNGGRRPDGSSDSRMGSHQQFVIAGGDTISRLPEGVDVTLAASLVGNFNTVVAIFTGLAGYEKPSLDGTASSKGSQKKVLVYGGTSSAGSLAVQYAAQAGYEVVTTYSPKHKDFVSKLGAVQIIDHTQDKDTLVEALIAEGPYDLVLDSISLPNTVAVNAAVLAAQGGGVVRALVPAFGPETLPEGVTRDFRSWGSVLDEEKNTGLTQWAFETWFPGALAKGKITPLAIEKVPGGLKGVNDAIERLFKGVSGVKLVADPWE